MSTEGLRRPNSTSRFESDLRSIGKRRERQFRLLRPFSSADQKAPTRNWREMPLNLASEYLYKIKDIAASVAILARAWLRAGASKLSDVTKSRDARSFIIFGSALVFATTGCWIASFLYFSSVYNAGYWHRKIAERTLSPIYGRDDVLVGALNSRSRLTIAPGQNAYALGFIPLATGTDVPAAYRAALLDREDRGLRDGGIHNICGVDFPRLVKAWMNGRGGSSLSMQIVKNLEGWGTEKSTLDIFIRKMKEVPAACQLYKHLAESNNADEKILRLYASMHTIWTPGTGIRGIEAGSRVTFDVPPQKLSIGQQFVLSAVTAGPLAPPAENEADMTKCGLIWPIRNNPSYDGELEVRLRASLGESELRQFRIRKNQCRTLWRAKHTARILHEQNFVIASDNQLEQVLSEIQQLEDTGMRPVNPFLGLTDADSVSLSKRTQEVVRPHLISLLRSEASALAAIEVGAPLNTRIDAFDQSEFVAKMVAVLPKIERQSIDTLCIPLTPTSAQTGWHSRCDGHGANVSAIVHVGSFNLQTGLMEKSYSDYGQVFDARFSIGSLAKWVILIAAAKAGVQPQDQFCPQSVTRNGKALRRVTEPRFGFSSCAAGRNLVSLLDATARSDNLAFFELANKLGKAQLNESLVALGLTAVPDPEYQLSFGLYEASLSSVMRMAQTVIAAANSVSITAYAPRLLITRTAAKKGQSVPLGLSPETGSNLKNLVDAPVRYQQGTLRRLVGFDVAGGKTGTTTSPTKNMRGENFTSGKWTVFYDASNEIVSVMLVASPRPSIPLATSNLRGAAFVDAETSIIYKNAGSTN